MVSKNKTNVAPSKQLTGETTSKGPLRSAADKREQAVNMTATKRAKKLPKSKRTAATEGLVSSKAEVAAYNKSVSKISNDHKAATKRNEKSAAQKTAAGKAAIKKRNSKGKK